MRIFPLALIAIGLFGVLKHYGLIDPAFLNLFWPLLLIGIGVAMLARGPRWRAEMRERIGWIDLIVRILPGIRQPHQRLGNAMRMMDVIEAETPLHAKAIVIGRAIAALGIDDLLVLDLLENVVSSGHGFPR